MAKPKVTLFVDIASPFAYLGFYALQNFSIFKQCEVTFVPILLGGLMKACGNTPPLHIKNKDKWIDIERIRWSRLFNIPVSAQAPEGSPINTLLIQRALTSLNLSHPHLLPQALGAFYHAFWVSFAAPQKPENTLSILASVVGDTEAKTVFERSTSAEVKKLLAEKTNEAMDAGAFGLPWFVATNSKGEKEGFWGFDHIGQMVDHLGLERPQTDGWKAML